MKFGNSSVPYLGLLLIILIGMPLANYQVQKSEQVVVEIQYRRSNQKQQIANSQPIEKEADGLLVLK